MCANTDTRTSICRAGISVIAIDRLSHALARPIALIDSLLTFVARIRLTRSSDGGRDIVTIGIKTAGNQYHARVHVFAN